MTPWNTIWNVIYSIVIVLRNVDAIGLKIVLHNAT